MYRNSLISTLRPDAPPFCIALAGLSAYAASYSQTVPTASGNAGLYHGNLDVVDAAIVRTISFVAVVVALVYCHQHGRELGAPIRGKSLVENLLLMMGFVEKDTDMPSQNVVKYIERLWVLYCDHEMTNSTAAFLHVASTLADPISCCAAYIASGNGPLHAGAIDLAYKAFARVGAPENVPAMIADVKAKKYRLFGYGHRIYKTVDPRAKLIKAMLDEFGEETKQHPLFAIAIKIDEIASQDLYFTLRNLKVNADLYGCFIYTAL